MRLSGNASAFAETPPLRLTLFGQPQIIVTHEERRPEVYPLPGDDWVLLLVYLAYFGERDSQGGIVERTKIESAWRDARAKDPRGTNEYFGYSAAGAVRNATSEMRRYIARLCEGTSAEGADIVELTGKGLLRLNRQVMSTDIADFFDDLRSARRAELPDEASLARERLTAAQHLFEEGEFLPGFEHRFGRYEILENGQGLESWVLDARRLLQTKQNQTAERLVKLAPFLLLPSYENAFVPREELSTTIREWLFEEGGTGGRLSALVLHGGYGAGKTRLAIETVRSLTIREALGLYPEGIAFLPLDSYFTQPGSATETAFLQAAAQRLRAPDGIQNSLTSHNASDFFRWIGSKPKRLLILDNGESLYSDVTAKALTRLLHATDGRLRCLITSRAAWPGLRHLPIEGMPLPSHPDDDFETYAGSRLYLERVRQRDPNYVIPDPMLLITAFEQTESQPLNIEILAGHAWDKGAEGLRALVEQRQSTFRALQGPDPPESDDSTDSSTSIAARRHRSAAASIFWSIDRLLPDDRAKFVCLAVFPYDWDAAAAEAICHADEEDLRTWRDLYLATYDRDRNRWLLRPRIREVTQELSAETVNHDMIHEKHRDYYVQFAESAFLAMRTSQLVSALATFEEERPNLRSAFEFCMEHPDTISAQAALRLASATQGHLVIRGWNEEAVSQLNAALAHPGAEKWTDSRMMAAQHLIFIRSSRMYQSEGLEGLARDMEDNLQLCDVTARVEALCSLGSYYTIRHVHDKAMSALSEAERLATNLNDHRIFTRIYTDFAGLAMSRQIQVSGDETNFIVTDEIVHWLEVARQHVQQTDNIVMVARAFTNEGKWAIRYGQLNKGFKALQNGLILAYQHNLPLQTAWTFGEFREYSLRVMQFADAVRFLTFEREYRHNLNFVQDFDLVTRLEDCYQALGEDAYQREVNIAASWSLEQAVEYALSLPPPPPD